MLTLNGVFVVGVRVSGEGEHTLGGEVDPATQLSATEVAYPLRAVTVPFKVAVRPANVVRGVLASDISKSGVITRLNSHMPRPYVDARSNCCPPEAKIPSAVTATFGRNPAEFVLGFGPSSVQSGLEVELAKTPMSVPTYTCPRGGYTTTAFTGESGRLPVKSVQVV